MAKQLYINGIEIDLDEKDNPISNTFAVNNIAELKDRQAYGTNTFKVPKTENNRRALGYPDNPAMIGDVPYRRNIAKIVQNGIEIVPVGIGTVKESTDSFSIIVVSGIKGFFEALGDVSLIDLNFDRLDHKFMESVIKASQQRNDYVYPVINYGQMKPEGRTVDPLSLRPAVFTKEVMKSIEMYTGFKMSGDVFSEQLYQNELIPFALDKFVHAKRALGGDPEAGVRYERTGEYIQDFITPANRFNDLYTVSFPVKLSDPKNQFDGTVFTSSIVMDAKLKVRLNSSLTIIPDAVNERVLIMSVSTQEPGSDQWYRFDESNFLIETGKYYTRSDLFIETVVPCVPGTKIRINLSASVERLQRASMFSADDGEFEIVSQPSETIRVGDNVEVSATLPDISAKDFLKDFLQRKGLTVIPVDGKNEVIFSSMSKLFSNKLNAKNWTDKIIHSSRNFSYLMSGYGINNYGKFKSDESVPKDLGRGNLTLDNQAVPKDDIELFTSIFAATEMSKALGENILPSIKKMETPLQDTPFDEIVIDYKQKTQPRILISQVKTSNIVITSTGSPGLTLKTIINVPYFDNGYEEGLSYESVFKYRYQELRSMLDRPLIMNVKAKLTEIDIINLDWEVPIYDEVSAQYYYLNEINSFVDGELTELTLIKI